MQHAYWEGIVVAETAGQLVLGGLFCATYAFTRKRVEWLGFGFGGLGIGIASAAPLAFPREGANSMRFAAMAFAAAMAIGVALVVFGVAWLARSIRIARLGWITAVAGGLWLLLLGYLNHPSVATTSKHWMSHPADPSVLRGGWIYLLHLAILVVAALPTFLRQSTIPTPVRRVIGLGLIALSIGFVVDGLSARLYPSAPRVFSHFALLFSAALATTLLFQQRDCLREAHATEQRLKVSVRELSAAQSNLERVQRELGRQKQLAAVGELAAAIAHEVRNPLAIIMNAAAGLRRPTLGSEDRTTLLSILDEESARLNRLVTDLLRFARPVIIKRSSVSIVELTRRAEGRLEDKYRLSISVPDRPELKFVQADANLLRLVFDNLVSNAFQAMPDGGVVQVAVDEEAIGDVRFVRIDIVDNGQGMDEQVLARATDPFYTTRPSGTGLGLPIVQRIVEAHGGRMEIESALGQGTKVSLFLPSVPPESESDSGTTGASS